jgi:phosphate transport system protein
MTNTIVRHALERELVKLRCKVLSMGSMVESAIAASIVALKGQNSDLAQEIIAGDSCINALRYEIEERCLELIATQQPAAGDLRAIIAATHLAVELERMGDYVKGIAEIVNRTLDQPLLKPLIDLPLMARIASEMIHGALDAYATCDAEAARQVAVRDEEIDGLWQQVFRELLTYMLADPRTVTRATYLLWVAHNLERIGDRATNLCERVIFMTTGNLVEIHP